MSEEFKKIHPDVRVPVSESGTGGGFKKFASGDIDITGASRPIKDSEREACAAAGIEFVELKIAIDGLSVMVNPKNTFCSRLSVDQLKQIWQPGSSVKTWKDVDPAWPAEQIKLYGADTASGTFDYFTEAICGKGGSSRTDYTASGDDNVLVKGIAGDEFSLGYFGYAYYVENQDTLKVLAIASGANLDEAIAPTAETIENGTYTPLSRPLFLYVRKGSLKRPEVQTFLRYCFGDGKSLVSEVGYVPIAPAEQEASWNALEAAISESSGT